MVNRTTTEIRFYRTRKKCSNEWKLFRSDAFVLICKIERNYKLTINRTFKCASAQSDVKWLVLSPELATVKERGRMEALLNPISQKNSPRFL